MYGLMNDGDRMNSEHAGEHVAGRTRQGEEERRKQTFFKKFHPDSNGSPTRLHEDFGGKDRNR